MKLRRVPAASGKRDGHLFQNPAFTRELTITHRDWVKAGRPEIVIVTIKAAE